MRVHLVWVGDGLSGDLQASLQGSGDLLIESRSAEAFWAEPNPRPLDLVILSAEALPVDASAAIARLRALPQKPEVAVLAAHLDDRKTLDLLAAGCSAVIPSGLDHAQLSSALSKLIQRRHEAMALALQASRATKLPSTADLESNSPAMQTVLRIARRVAVSDTSLLLLGETGVGKEWLAAAVHNESPRASGPFIAINCGAIPESLLESELFGHEKGAFTGAVRARRGYFEQAHGGVLFLDEIGDMPPHLQMRLLRVLQDRTIQRLGGEGVIDVDTRIIAATHRDLESALDSGQFRRDLYYRLAVVTLTMPPLRERREDIPTLAQRYLESLRRKLGRPEVTAIRGAALDALQSYDWPGNVRELINVIERAVLLCEHHEIDLHDLPNEIAMPRSPNGATLPHTDAGDRFDAWLDQPIEAGRVAVVESFERHYYAHLLRRHQGHIGHTAQQAGVDPRTLYNKMRQLGLSKEDFKVQGGDR